MTDSLSVARINRLLRQLGARCSSLARLRGQEIAQPITYSTKASNPLGPLTILRPPENSNWRQSRRETSQSLQLTTSIYAVRQAYANIVQAAFNDEGCTPCPSLASICAHVAGRGVYEINGDEEGEEGEEDEQQSLAYVNDLFEAVPVHHRRWMLISHALTTILHTCPHHHTLLHGLLEATIRVDAPLVSQQILERLLFIAAAPPQLQPPILHPAHSTFLIDLLSLWTSHAHLEYTFTRIFSTVLPNSSPDVWTCKAMSKFLYALKGRDFGSFMLMLENLADATAKSNSPDLLPHLLKWGRIAFENMVNIPSQQEWTIAPFLRVIDTPSLRRVVFREIEDIPNTRDSNSIVCLALHAALTAAPLERPELVSILQKCHPHRSMFNTLVCHILDPVHDFGFMDSSTRITQMHNELETYANFLVNHDLHKLEAPLWLCALYYVEHPEAEGSVIIRGTSEEISQWCRKLVSLVDDAEKRAAAKTKTIRNQNRDGKRIELQEVLGCYVLPSPLPISKPKPFRRLSNFDTLLSDARANRFVLHPNKRRRITFEDEDDDKLENVALATPCPPRHKPCQRNKQGPNIQPDAGLSIPSSDDALDLFACETSPLKR